MPGQKYRKPPHQVVKTYHGGEMDVWIQYALERTFESRRIRINTRDVFRFLSYLTSGNGGGSPVFIVEQYPLNSITAHGRHNELIYARVRKIGNQYSKNYTIPRNPRTVAQQN